MTKFIDVSGNTTEERQKTVFTHIACSGNGWVITSRNPAEVEMVKYLGKCRVDGDMFAAYYNNGIINIFKGIKGSEFK